MSGILYTKSDKKRHRTQRDNIFALLGLLGIVAVLLSYNHFDTVALFRERIGLFVFFPIALFLCSSFGPLGGYGTSLIAGTFHVLILIDERNYVTLIWLQIYIFLMIISVMAYVEIFEVRNRFLAEVEDEVARRTTELQKTLRELEEAKLKVEETLDKRSEFIGLLCHEIRNPLHCILNFTEFLKESRLDIEQAKFVTSINASAKFMHKFVNDVLDVSKFEAGKVVLESIPVKFDDLLKSFIGLSHIQCVSLGVKFIVKIDESLPKVVMTDPIRCQQIFNNLLSNALKFTPRGGTIYFGVKNSSKTEEMVSLEAQLRDTGIGMNSESLTRLFIPYTQATSSTTREYGGSGLGLSIVNKIVQEMNGEINVVSKLNEGTCFTVRLTMPIAKSQNADNNFQKTGAFLEKDDNPSSLPDQLAEDTFVKTDILVASQEEDQTKETFTILDSIIMSSVRPSSLVPLNPGHCILIVDDSKVNRLILARIFSRLQISTIEAINGKEALSVFDREKAAGKVVAMIMMDINMPEMDGIAATQELRAKGYHGPVIASTANLICDNGKSLIEFGFTEVASKPFQQGDALKLLKTYCLM